MHIYLKGFKIMSVSSLKTSIILYVETIVLYSNTSFFNMHNKSEQWTAFMCIQYLVLMAAMSG